MYTRQIRYFEAHREPIDRQLRNLQVTYTIGHDYDREISLRVRFVSDVLAHFDNCKPYLLHVISLYFTRFYNITAVFHLSLSEYCCGATIDTEERVMYIICDDSLLERSIACAELISCERIVINDYPLLRYDSSVDKRVFSILAVVMLFENYVFQELCVLSLEKTLGEMIMANEKSLRKRCAEFQFRTIKRKKCLPTTTTKPTDPQVLDSLPF